MTTPRKFVPILVAGVLGLGSLALLTAAWGEPGRGMGGPGPHSWGPCRMMLLQRPARPGSGFGPDWHGRGGAGHARQEARRDGDRDRHPRQSARCVARFHRRAAGHGEAAIRTQRLGFEHSDSKEPFALCALDCTKAVPTW